MRTQIRRRHEFLFEPDHEVQVISRGICCERSEQALCETMVELVRAQNANVTDAGVLKIQKVLTKRKTFREL
jgi:hypothetical protein